MTHHTGFLRDIIEHPEEDAPRLIYADWLEDNGDSDRAEFIRVQCELARLGECKKRGQHLVEWCRPCNFRRRERELLTASHALDWGPDRALWDAGFDRAIMTSWESGESLPPGYAGTLFRRGFVAEVTLPCAEWLKHGPALARAAPLERVGLSDVVPPRPCGGGTFLWAGNAAASNTDYRGSVPVEIWKVLLGLPNLCTGTEFEGRASEHPTEAAALDALSRACLKWASKPAAAH